MDFIPNLSIDFEKEPNTITQGNFGTIESRRLFSLLSQSKYTSFPLLFVLVFGYLYNIYDTIKKGNTLDLETRAGQKIITKSTRSLFSKPHGTRFTRGLPSE